MSRGAEAVAAAVAWGAALALLALFWIRSPFTGPGRMFLLWSGAALPLAGLTWGWLRARRVEEVPTGVPVLVLLGVAWAAAAGLAASGAGGELALDALILRRPGLRALGRALQWTPGVVGLGIGVAGLAAALEARYRLVRRDPGGPDGGAGDDVRAGAA